MKDYQAKVEILQDKVASLENSLEEANQKLRLAENADQKKDDVSFPLSEFCWVYFKFFESHYLENEEMEKMGM